MKQRNKAQEARCSKEAKLPWSVADMALHHHERLDGLGYPGGISGEELSLEVRILALCNVVEAMSSPRHHRAAKSKEEVLQEIRSGRGTKYDPDLVDIVLQIIERGEFGMDGGVDQGLSSQPSRGCQNLMSAFCWRCRHENR